MAAAQPSSMSSSDVAGAVVSGGAGQQSGNPAWTDGLSQEERERALAVSTSFSPAELQRAKEIAERSSKGEPTAKGPRSGAVALAAGYTFSNSMTERLYQTAATFGVGAAAGLCAVIIPAGPVGKALGSAGCAAAAYFILSYGNPGPNDNLRVELQWSPPFYGFSVV